MISVEFPQVNCALAKDQEEYETLHVFVDTTIPERPMTACFQLNKEEIDEIVRTGKLWYTQYTFGHLFQPVSMSTQNPFQ
jgi:hypothetical protein